MVLAPVRELAAQILTEFRRFAKAHEGLRCVGVLGGGSKTDNFRELRNCAEVVVGTPGRLVDVCRGGNKSATNLRRVTYLVLDEADRMLDMGSRRRSGRYATGAGRIDRRRCSRRRCRRACERCAMTSWEATR